MLYYINKKKNTIYRDSHRLRAWSLLHSRPVRIMMTTTTTRVNECVWTANTSLHVHACNMTYTRRVAASDPGTFAAGDVYIHACVPIYRILLSPCCFKTPRPCALCKRRRTHGDFEKVLLLLLLLLRSPPASACPLGPTDHVGFRPPRKTIPLINIFTRTCVPGGRRRQEPGTRLRNFGARC